MNGKIVRPSYNQLLTILLAVPIGIAGDWVLGQCKHLNSRRLRSSNRSRPRRRPRRESQ